MQGHRNGGPPGRPSPWSAEYRAQKIVLAQLVIDPPAAGDAIATLPEVLELPAAEAAAAITALIGMGLVDATVETVYATETALYFEYLWPVML